MPQIPVPSRSHSVRLTLLALAALAGLIAVGVADLSGSPRREAVLLSQFTGPTLVVGLMLIGACLALRRPRMAAAMALACMVLSAAMAPQLLPAGARAERGSPTVRLYLANIYIRNENVAAIARSIREAEADIVVLTEINSRVLLDEARMARILPDHPHRLNSAVVGGPYRMNHGVIASRYPLQAEMLDQLDGIAAMHVRLDTPLGPLSVTGAHLTRPWPFLHHGAQDHQLGRLIERLERIEGPHVVAGDFNSTPATGIGQRLRIERRLASAPSWPGTWPSVLPAPLRIGIDNVFVSRELSITARTLAVPNASDHSPVIVEIRRARAARADQGTPAP